MEEKNRLKLSPIETELKDSYISYSLSVIASRAIPDARDGLKPVQRRILYAMYKSKLFPGKKFRKSATVVGATIGSYHPHGDTPVYEALVRMAQNFSLRYPLVEGQGNFGSIDGDPPAAMRYTECRLSKIGKILLENIEKKNVEFKENFDSTKKEPLSLPSPLPILLLNGASGIAVGLATYIFPHNLEELINAFVYYIENKDCTIKELLNFIKGPDFPTGGVITSSKQELKDFYETGKGKIILRSVYKIENQKIIITEIPYQVNKAETLKKIAELVKAKKLEEIKAIRDESDRNGIRIVFEIKKGFDKEIVLKKLFYFSDLQKVYYGNFVALKDGIEPKLFNLKEYFENFLNYRIEVIKKELNYDLKEAKARLEILEALKKALDKIDEVIELIKNSKDRTQASEKLMEFLEINQTQAEAILDTKLEKLAQLETQKILEERKQKIEFIKQTEEILKDPKKIEAKIIEKLKEIKEKFKDKRRTKIIEEKELSSKDIKTKFIQKKKNLIILGEQNYIKKISYSQIKLQHRATTGVFQKIKDEKYVKKIIPSFTTHDLILISNKGKIFKIKNYKIREKERRKTALPISSFIDLEKDEQIIDILSIGENRFHSYKYFITATKNGLIKKTKTSSVKSFKKNGSKIIKLKENDKLIGLKLAKDDNYKLVLITKKGLGFKLSLKKINKKGKIASGIIGIRKKIKEDLLKDFIIIDERKDKFILIATENGFSKIIKIEDIKELNPGARGIILLKTNIKTGDVSKILKIGSLENEVIVFSRKGYCFKTKLSQIPVLGRQAKGVKLIKLQSNDKFSDICIIK